MATLTDGDFTEIRNIISSDPVLKAEFKAWNLAKDVWKAIFQASEDWFVNGFNTTPTTSFKAALDAVSTTTGAQAKAIGKVWFAWRIGITW